MSSVPWKRAVVVVGLVAEEEKEEGVMVRWDCGGCGVLVCVVGGGGGGVGSTWEEPPRTRSSLAVQSEAVQGLRERGLRVSGWGGLGWEGLRGGYLVPPKRKSWWGVMMVVV